MIVIYYVMDSLRPDFLSCYGYGKETSPHIDRLARESVLFTNAFAQSTWTRSSGASLLSSTYPWAHGLWTTRDTFPPTLPIVPEILKKKGFTTIAITSMGNISPYFGFGKGFDHYIETYKETGLIEKRKKIEFAGWGGSIGFRLKGDELPIMTSEDLNHFLLPFLEENKEKDLFVFVWSLDTHDPYFHRDRTLARFCPPGNETWESKDLKHMKSEEDRRHLKELYDDMIFYNDHHVGVLIEKLKEMNVFDQTLFVLTSDHGESFGEHGVNSHGGVPYDEQIHVPLIIKFFGSRFSGKTDGLVQHIDIVPTILEAVKAENDGTNLQGKSLFPLVRDGEEVNDFIFAGTQLNIWLRRFSTARNKAYKYLEAVPGKFTFQRSPVRMLYPLVCRMLKEKLFFDVKEDPAERVNLFKERKEMAEDFRSRIEAIAEESRKQFGATAGGRGKNQVEDEEVAKQLKGLGYFE